MPPLPLPGIPDMIVLILYWIILLFIGGILLAMLIRAILSWFQMDERFAFVRFLAHVTDPFIMPCRRFVRVVGILDFSWIVAFFLLSTLELLLWQSIGVLQ